MAAFIDLYIWPFYGRFRPARAFAVHLGEDNRNGAKLVENRHFAEAATELEPFLPPRFVCTPFRYERDGALERAPRGGPSASTTRRSARS